MPLYSKTHIVPKGWGLALLIWLSSLPSYAQIFSDSAFQIRAAQGLTQTYNAEFELAQELFSQLQTEYPTHPAPPFLLATNRWWQSMMCYSHHFDSYIDTQLQRSLELNEKYLQQSDYPQEYILFQYLGYALHARLASHRKEWLTAANRGRKALPYLDDCLAFADDNVEFCFAAGIYHYYADTYPASNALVRPFMAFFPDGDVQKGIDELERSVAQPNFTRPEAMYYLSYIYLEPYARDTLRAQQIAHQLRQEYPHNPWFACEYARVHVHTGVYGKAFPVLNRLITAYEAQPFALTEPISSKESVFTTKLALRAHHYRGLCFLDGNHDTESAKKDFKASLHYADLCGITENHYVAASYFYLGQCHEALDEVSEAKSAYQRCVEIQGDERIRAQAKESLLSLEKP